MAVENASSRVWMRWCLAGILAASPISAMPLLAYEGARAPAAPVAIRETADLSDAFKAAGEEATPQGPVLLILDIDNTLLTMPQYLGGDRWFNHHAAAIAARTDPDFSSLGELIAVQTMLFGVASMQATEPDIPAMLADARRQNIDIFLLSARGPELFDATRRELDRNGLEVEAPYACSFFLCTEDGVYRDGEIRAALAAIGEEPSRSLYRNILIRDGMMLAAGQDKGVMLKLLMGAIGGRRYTHVVVADDGRKNIDDIAASHNPVPITLFHYRRIDPSVSDAEDRAARGELATLTAALCSAMQSALCRKPVLPDGAGK
ncbi:MAG: hypothetical protein CVT74_03190 [Alphaproteobacteria bacterium HGW-Alphaproteobacteria-13]|nr:MAG: hypothetical protein CVT74_03190 [Alphaproteobacteria bacterium HGW-Alphaproteobacteria-13]